MGKGTKEVSDEKPGVVLTRIVNKPIKDVAAHLQKSINTLDRALEKLDKLSGRFTIEKEAEKGGRTSVKDRLSQMKVKAEQQKKAPDKVATKSKAKCL